MKGLSVRSACLIGVLSSTAAGCVYVPKTADRYDTACKTVQREMYLEPIQVASLEGCKNVECKAGLVVAGAVTATSAVISGSIVLVGNVVYWLEKQGDCPNQRNLAPRDGWLFARKTETYTGEFAVDMATVRRKRCSAAQADCVRALAADPAQARDSGGENAHSESPDTR